MTERDSLELAVARVVKPHGIRGELVLDVLTDSPQRRFGVGTVLEVRWRSSKGKRNLTVTSARPHGGRMLLCADGINSRDDAELLRGGVLFARIPPDESTDDPEEFHDHQLEGLRVDTTESDRIGTVREVVHTPAGELLAVRTPTDAEILIPFVADIVPEVDTTAGRIVVDPPEGLLGEA